MEKDPVYKFRVLEVVEETPQPSSPTPKPRSGHRIVNFNDRIYCFGGYNPATELLDPALLSDPHWASSRPLFKELWEFNLTNRVWRKLAVSGDVPEQLASHTAGLHPTIRGRMIIYGGTGSPFGSATSTSVISCSLTNGSFSLMPMLEPPEEPIPLYGQAMVLDDDGNLYTVGGTTGFQYFMDVHSIDISSAEPVWKKLNIAQDEEEPYPRYRHEMCLYKNRLYILGGGTSTSVCGFQIVPTFSIEDKKWRYLETKPDSATTIDIGDGNGYPDARRCHGAVLLGNKVFIIGGYDGHDIYGDIWQLDLDLLQWKRLNVELPVPVYFHAATVSQEGKLVVFGGVDSITDNTRTSRVFSTWITIPSLRCLSWEALKYYIPNIDSVESSKLREIGVPGDCVETVTADPADIG